MKSLLSFASIFVFCFFIFCGNSGCKKCTTKTISVSLLSYNVAGLPQGISSSNPERNTIEIGKLINEYDIVHTQEDFCYHDSLLANNKHPFKTETKGCVPGGDGLNTFSNFAISNLDRIPWTDCTSADCFTPKGFSYTQIALANGVLVDFYNVHCNAGSSVESKAARRQNLIQLSNYINLHSKDKAIVLMGDFNSRYTRDGDTASLLLELGFKDIWLDRIRGGIVPDVSATKLDDCTPDRNNVNCERIDKIFYRSSAAIRIEPTYYKVDDDRYYFNGDKTMDLSDHWPVFAKLNFTF